MTIQHYLIFSHLVGAGSAGCVLANRLTENGQFSVLLLEAGGNDMGNYIYDIPGYTDKAVRTHADWGYHTEPQKHAYKAYKKEVKGIKGVESGVYKYMCMSNLHFQTLNYDSEYILQILIS